MISALIRGHCVVFYFHSASLQPGVFLGVTLRWPSISSRGSRNSPSRFMLQKPG